MHIQQRATLLSLLAAAALFATSCDNSFGVFASIQDEIEQTGTDIFKNSSVTRALATTSKYYAIQNRLFSRPATGGSWEVVPVNGERDYKTCRSAVARSDGSAIYASVEGSTGSNGVFRSSDDGATWTVIGVASQPAGSVVDNLFFANGYLFAQLHLNYSTETAADDAYSLYYSDGSADFAEVDSATLSSAAQPFVGVAWDGSSYWYASKGALFSDDGPGGAAAAPQTSAAGLSGQTITSIAYSAPAAALYVGTYGAKLFQYAASTWSSKNAGSGGPITAIVDVGSSSSHLLLGEGFNTDDDTDGGYYEGDFGSLSAGDGGDVAKSESIYDTTVNGTGVNGFLWDPAHGTLFICVSPGAKSSLYGLYSSTYATSWSGWDAE